MWSNAHSAPLSSLNRRHRAQRYKVRPPAVVQYSFIYYTHLYLVYNIHSIMVRTTLCRTVDPSAHIPWPQGCCMFSHRLRHQHHHLSDRGRHHGNRPRHHDGASSTNRTSSYTFMLNTRVFQVLVTIWDAFVDILCCRCFTPRWRRGGRRWRTSRI